MSGGDDDEPVGYRRPPKKHRFKKGQSGCPDGGWPKKRAKQARAKRKAERSPQQCVEAWFKKKRRVRINGKDEELTLLDLALLQLEEAAFVQRDPKAQKLFFAMAERNGYLKAPPPRIPGTGVLVVYPIMEQEEWIKATEGELLPKNPLHGVPGAEGLMPNPETAKRMYPPDEDDT